MNDKMLKYEFSEEVVNYLLNAVNRSQIVGVQNAKNLLAVVDLLQLPKNRDDLDKDTYEALKNRFDSKQEEKEAKSKK